jgi:hypothetical protein
VKRWIQGEKGKGYGGSTIALAMVVWGIHVTIRSLGSVGAADGMALWLADCASIIEGKTQGIAVGTNPAGAECGLHRERGMRLAIRERLEDKALQRVLLAARPAGSGNASGGRA